MKRSFALLAAVALLMALFIGTAAQTEEQLQQEMQQIEQRIAAQRQEITRLRGQQADQEQLLPALDAQVQALDEKLEVLNNDLLALNTSIEELNVRVQSLTNSITESQRKIDEIIADTQARNAQIEQMQQQLKERLRQQYMDGPVSNLQLLLSTADLSDLLTVSELIVRQAEEDARLRGNLEGEMARLQELQRELQHEQAQYEQQRLELQREAATLAEQVLKQREEKARIDAQVEEISAVRAEIEEIIAGFRRQSAAAQRVIDREYRAFDDAQRRINAMINERMGTGEIGQVQNDGRMVWPFPHRGCFITSRFGNHESFRANPHRGVDVSIANNWRTDWRVVAALCGVLADFGYNSSMGNFVVIYHGHFPPANGRIQTVYMHLHSFASGMRRGMSISAGQHIGMMGNTGRSTGPHLHFQVDVINANGSRTAVDPMRFVTGAPYLIPRPGR